MTRPFLRSASFALVTLASALPSSAFACATCGCSLSTDAAMGFSAETGWRASLQVDYLDQSQLRTGTHAISRSSVARLNDAGGDQEVERDTVNRYVTLGLDYAPDADWSARLLVPYVDRGHSTYGSASNPVTPDERSGVNVTGLGDVRLIGTWQGLLPEKNLGFQLGLKLPTGDYGGPNADGTGVVGRHPTPFGSGPIAANPSPGNLVDTSLQPGTGSTDAIVGAFYHQPVSVNVEAFGSVQFQAAFANRLNQAGEDFRPGNTATVTAGARYEVAPGFVPQVQVNLYHKGRDQGALADNPDSAGTVAYVSPGATVTLVGNLQAFGFAQLPVYSHLVGIQLAPRWTASMGLSVGF